MEEQRLFSREHMVEITAATIGISKNKWVALPQAQATKPRAISIMQKHRFDVLPIADGETIRAYYQANEWNNPTAITRKSITHRDTIPLYTPIRTLIKEFAQEAERRFFFLSHNARISGLVSIVHLNRRQVKVYLFSLLSELEMTLSQFIAKHVPEQELLDIVFDGTNDNPGRYEKVKAHYRTDQENGVEVPFVEYLYLSDLINIAIAQRLYQSLGYTRGKFERALGSLNDLRHTVAHPTRSLITTPASVSRLWRRMDRIEEALFKLHQANP